MNRLDTLIGTSTGAAYKYRADGMRVNKVEGYTMSWVWNPDMKSGYYDENININEPTTRYFYDGQMPVEEDFTREVEEEMLVDITKYGIGARGIDLIGKTPDGSGETVYFPIYDGHGNQVALLTRNGTGYTDSNRRAYDAWGMIRQGATTGEPKGRYCANLGHVQDDESGLTYMRARYYEPWTGRFVSEDPGMHGSNWFIYASNDPTNRVDQTGLLDTKPGPGALLAFLNDLFQFAMAKFGIEVDDRMTAIFLATSEAAKALTFLEGSIYLYNSSFFLLKAMGPLCTLLP